jgi:hypothetical protein
MYRQSTGLLDFVYSGEGSSIMYNNWAANQPDMIPSGQDANCVAAYSPKQFRWYDAPCNNVMLYICAM